MHLAQAGFLVGEVAHSESHQHGIEGTVCKRQRGGVALGKDDVGATAIEQLVAAYGHHRAVDVGENHTRCAAIARRRHMAGRQPGDVSSAASKIQHPFAGPQPGHFHRRALQQPVAAQRHQVVHQVVALGNGVEHAANTPRLFRRRHPLAAEIDLHSACFE